MHSRTLNACQKSSVPAPASRRGAAVVEFAIMAPLYLVLTIGVVELGYALNASNTLHGVVREGGRLASQDFTKTVGPGQTANEKVIQDIRNMLTAARIDGEDATITIEPADSPGSEFDLEDEDNYLEYFRIQITIPWSDVANLPGKFLTGQELAAGMTFRMGRVMMPD